MRHSYSSLQTFNKCALQFKFSYIDKMPRGEPHPNAARGTEIHNSIEAFMKEEGELHSEIISRWGHQLHVLRDEAECIPEPMWLLDEDFQPTENEDEAMLKGFFDLKVIWDDAVDIKEWKTGKLYDEHDTQRYLYGMVALIQHPEVESVEVEGVYLDLNKKVKNEYKREDMKFMKNDWAKRINHVENAIERNMFPPNPQFLCRYCDFSKQNGGPCQF